MEDNKYTSKCYLPTEHERLAKEIEACVNGSDKGLEEALKDLFAKRTHRTLQQSFVRVMVSVLLEIGENEHFDARNEAAVKFCKQLKELNTAFPLI